MEKDKLELIALNTFRQMKATADSRDVSMHRAAIDAVDILAKAEQNITRIQAKNPIDLTPEAITNYQPTTVKRVISTSLDRFTRYKNRTSEFAALSVFAGATAGVFVSAPDLSSHVIATAVISGYGINTIATCIRTRIKGYRDK